MDVGKDTDAEATLARGFINDSTEGGHVVTRLVLSVPISEGSMLVSLCK